MGNSTVEENYQKGVCSHIFSKPETPSQLPSSLSGILLIILRPSIIFSTHPTTQISSNSYYENPQWHFPNWGAFTKPAA